ncbi:MAG: phytanoyl-CoA dioxygenase family protein [Mucilaginibacter sp.]|uniref:phytanoyl-CoA dioxygenase family protein n=1 Tax=Mucilaginibacter sp. TaxID=1882438 RepID=UPI0032669E37
MITSPIIISTETGKLQIMHLKRYWNKSILKREGKMAQDELNDEWQLDTTLLGILGIGLEQTIKYVYQNSPSFEEFETWIVNASGIPDQVKVKQFNRLFSADAINRSEPGSEKVLSADELKFWEQNGYVIVRNAVSKVDCEKTIAALCSFIEIDRYDAATWYNAHPARQGIMVQLFQHPVLESNRKSDKIRIAYEQLWNRTDLFGNADRVGFNPPQTEAYPFQGPRLHWDVSLDLPIPFGLQGILYLADTAENQGAFTLVPGFHNRVDSWINSLPAGANPRTEDLYALGTRPIAANAGDFIIWHQALPHGSSPNTTNIPRFVQYINYAPADEEKSKVWK